MTELDHDLLQMSHEEAELICAAMHIGGSMRTAFLLGAVEGQSVVEIAERMALSPDAVLALLSDAQALTTEHGTRSRPARDLLEAVRNTVNTSPHTPHYAVNEYTQELQKTQLRDPLVDERDVTKLTWRDGTWIGDGGQKA